MLSEKGINLHELVYRKSPVFSFRSRLVAGPADQHGCDPNTGQTAGRSFSKHGAHRDVSHCLWQLGRAW